MSEHTHPESTQNVKRPTPPAWGKAVVWTSIFLAFLGFLTIPFTLPEIDGVSVAWAVPILDVVFLAFVVGLLVQKKTSTKSFVAALLIIIFGTPVIAAIIAAIFALVLSVTRGT